MITEKGIITHIDSEHNQVWVQTQAKTACGHCAQSTSCTSGVLARFFTRRQPPLVLDKPANAHIGQQVDLVLPAGALLKGTVLLYLLPLLCMIVLSMLAHLSAQHFHFNDILSDVFSLIFAVLGLWFGFIIARYKILASQFGLAIKT